MQMHSLMKPSKMVGFFHVLIILIPFQQVVKSYQEGGPGSLVRDEVSEIRPGDEYAITVEYAITGNQADNRQQGNVFEGKVQSQAVEGTQNEDQNYGSMNSLENERDSDSNSVMGNRVAEAEVEERRNDQTGDKSEQQDEDTIENMEEDEDNATTENYGDNFDSIIDNVNRKEAVAMLDYGSYTSKDEEEGITGIEDEGNKVDIMEAEGSEDGIEKDRNDNEEDEVEVENEGNVEKEIEQDNEVKEEKDDTGRDNDGDGTGTEDEGSKTDIVEIEEEDETGKNEEKHKDGTTEEKENDIEEETPEVEQVKDEIRMETKEGNAETKDVSADNVDIEQGNEDQDIVDYEGYVAKSDDDSKPSFRIEDSRRHVQQEKESEHHNEMAENEMHTCKPSKNKNKIYKDKGRKKKEEKRKRRRKNKQRRHKKTRKDKQRRNRGRDKQKNSKNKQRKYKSGYKRKSGRKSRRNKGTNERYKNEIRLILDGIRNLHSLSRQSICIKIKRKLEKLSNSGRISYKGRDTISFKSNSQSSINLRKFIPTDGYTSLKINSVLFHCRNAHLTMEAESAKEWKIIPNYMSISRVAITVSVIIKSPQQTFRAGINGVWRIGRLHVPISVSYDHARKLTRVRAIPQRGTSLTSFVKSITGLTVPIGTSYNVGFKFEGEVSSEGATNLLLTSHDGHNKYYAVYKKQGRHSKALKAIAIDVRRFKLSKLVRKILKLDISQVPFFGRLIVPEVGMIYSTGKTKTDVESVFKRSSLLQTTKDIINKGFTAFMRVSFHHEPLIMRYDNNTLVITTPHRNLRLNKLIQKIAPPRFLSKVSLPFIPLNEILNLFIEEATISKSSVCAAVSYPRELTFFWDILKLSSIKAQLCFKDRKPKLSAKLTGSIRVGGLDFETKLAQNKLGKYFLLAESKGKLSFNKLIHSFHASILPRELSRLLRNIPFLKFSIHNPKLSHTFGVKPLQLHVGGLPSIHGYRIVNMDLLVLRKNKKLQLISGFQLGKINLASLLSRVTGFNFKRFSILDQSTSPTFTISPVTIPRVHLSGGKLGSLPVLKGFSLKATLRFPRNCKSDKFCKFAGRLIGYNTILSLSATIRSATYYSITASLQSLNLGKGLRLRRAGLEIIGGASSRIGIVGEVKLHKPNLVFAGRIAVGTKGLTLQLSMRNCWHKAFGVSWLDICNLLGAIDFAPPTGITGLALGGQINLGYRSTGRQLKAKAYIGVSLINIVENYYYAKFSRVTMRSLLQAFKINWKLPRVLGNSGFPKGFTSSFSFLGKELPEVGLSIPRGFTIKGTLNILGLQGHGDITIDLPRLLDVSVALPPIKIGRIFSMYASHRNRNSGPYLKSKLSLYHRRVNIEAKGYLKVLGVSFNAELKITNSFYSFSFRQKLFHLFWANVYMRASYGNIRRANFYVRGSFGLDLFKGIQNIAKNLVRSFSEAAKKAVDVAMKAYHKYQRLRKSVQRKLDRLYRILRYWKKKIFFNQAQTDEFEYPKENAHISFRFRRAVRRVVRGGRRAVRRVVRGGRRAVRRVARYGRRVIKRVNHFAQRKYNAAKKGINKAKREFNKISHLLQKAKNHLNYVRRHFKRGLKMFDYIRRYGYSRIIHIRRITFSASLSTASTGHFSCRISVEFLKKMRHINASINLRHLNKIGMQFFHLVKQLF